MSVKRKPWKKVFDSTSGAGKVHDVVVLLAVRLETLFGILGKIPANNAKEP